MSTRWHNRSATILASFRPGLHPIARSSHLAGLLTEASRHESHQEIRRLPR